MDQDKHSHLPFLSSLPQLLERHVLDQEQRIRLKVPLWMRYIQCRCTHHIHNIWCMQYTLVALSSLWLIRKTCHSAVTDVLLCFIGSSWRSMFSFLRNVFVVSLAWLLFVNLECAKLQISLIVFQALLDFCCHKRLVALVCNTLPF